MYEGIAHLFTCCCSPPSYPPHASILFSTNSVATCLQCISITVAPLLLSPLQSKLIMCASYHSPQAMPPLVSHQAYSQLRLSAAPATHTLGAVTSPIPDLAAAASLTVLWEAFDAAMSGAQAGDATGVSGSGDQQQQQQQQQQDQQQQQQQQQKQDLEERARCLAGSATRVSDLVCSL